MTYCSGIIRAHVAVKRNKTRKGGPPAHGMEHSTPALNRNPRGGNMARVKWIPAVMLVAFLLPGCARKATANAADQQRAASVMLDHFETVFNANGDLLSGSGGYRGLSQQDANTLRAPFTYLLQGLDVLGKAASNE